MRYDDLLYKLAITFIPGIGDVLAKNLVSYCGSVEQVFREKKPRLLRIPGIGDKMAQSIAGFKDFQRAEKEITFIEKHKIKPLFYLDDDYPKRLQPIHDAPVMLYYLGHADVNNDKIIGIVGTRKASDYGKSFIDELTAGLKETGSLIVSGLAYGIDIHAHRQALKQHLPTIGILGHGLDRIYPYQHQNTAKRMIENGGLLTEFPSCTNPDRENFPKRNRVVAGICDVLIIVETAIKGGSIITAEIANSYNKDIMALPGRVKDEYSAGCNDLIRKNKASIITCTEDLFELMNWGGNKKSTKGTQESLDLRLDETGSMIIRYIREKEKAGLDNMAFELAMDPGILSLRLLDLELRNFIRTLPGKHFELV